MNNPPYCCHDSHPKKLAYCKHYHASVHKPANKEVAEKLYDTYLKLLSSPEPSSNYD